MRGSGGVGRFAVENSGFSDKAGAGAVAEHEIIVIKRQHVGVRRDGHINILETAAVNQLRLSA